MKGKKMKTRLILVTVLVLCVIFTARAFAQLSSTMTQTVSRQHPFSWSVTTLGRPTGLVSGNVVWTPIKGGHYTYRVFKYNNPSDPFGSSDPNYQCSYDSHSTIPGNWLCAFNNAPPGYYLTWFTVEGKAVSVTETISYP